MWSSCAHANQPGYDLRVDGNPVQVKCTLYPSAVHDHFERYPDIPVVVNAELGEALGDHPLVWVDPALSHAEVAASTQDSLEALAGFGDVDDLLPVPLLSVVFAAHRNYGDLQAGRIDRERFAERVAVETAARTAGAAGAGAAGALVGSLLGPVGTVVGGALGSYLGSVAGGTGADAINRKAVCDRRDDVVRALTDLGRWFTAQLLPPRIAVLAARRQAVADWARRARAAHGDAPWILLIHAAAIETHRRAEELQAWLAHQLEQGPTGGAHAGWVALREVSSFLHPDLRARLAKVSTTFTAYTAQVDAPHGAYARA